MATDEERALMIARLQTLPPGIRFSTLSGKTMSRDEAIQAVREGTEDGDLIVTQNLAYLRGLKN